MVDPAGLGLAPIEVYKVGEVYFVLDGNHRVSIAKQEGFEFIEAHVIEVRTEIPITPDLQPDELIIKVGICRLPRENRDQESFPQCGFECNCPGQYEKLLEHIEVHRYFMGLDLQRQIPYQEAVKHWYETVYTPVVEPIRERGLLRWFPGRTETDLYVWVSEHLATLKEELGWSFFSADDVAN
jgi:hypothetical protein